MEVKSFNTAHDLNAILNRAYDSGQRVKLINETSVAVYEKPTSVFGRFANWIRDITGANRREHNQVVDAFVRMVDAVPDVRAAGASHHPDLRDRANSYASPNTSEASRAELASAHVIEAAQMHATNTPPALKDLEIEVSKPDTTIRFDDAQKSALKVDAEYLKTLDTTIASVKNSFDDGSWGHNYILSGQFAPALIALENLKKPNLNLHYCNSIAEMRSFIQGCVDQKIPHANVVVRLDDSEHVAYFDYKLTNGIPSVLQLDSASYGPGATGALLHGVRRALEGLGQNIKFCGIDIGVQKSYTECSIFALNIAKQILKDPQGLDQLHELNAKERLLVSSPDYPSFKPASRNADFALPARLMKHSQSTTRTKDYLEENPTAANQPINSKGETLEQYQARNAAKVKPEDAKALANSIYVKRLDYLRELRSALS